MDANYVEYLQSAEWYEKRNRIMQRDGYTCQNCGSQEYLQVHHKTYAHIFHELDEELITLCTDCHKDADQTRKRQQRAKIWENRLEGWATKVFGPGWYYNPGREEAEERFEEWLAERECDDY